MQRGSVKKKLPVLLPFPPILFLNVGKKTLPFIIKRSDDNMPWPTQFKIMLELKRNQIIFQAIFLGMWPRKNTTPTTIANGLPKRPQRKKWYDMMWYDIIWYDMIWYDMIWYDMIYISEWAWGNSNATQQTRLSMMISWPMDEQAFKNNGRGSFWFSILTVSEFQWLRAGFISSLKGAFVELRCCFLTSIQKSRSRIFFPCLFLFFVFWNPYYFFYRRSRRRWLRQARRAEVALLFLAQEAATHTAALTLAGA